MLQNDVHYHTAPHNDHILDHLTINIKAFHHEPFNKRPLQTPLLKESTLQGRQMASNQASHGASQQVEATGPGPRQLLVGQKGWQGIHHALPVRVQRGQGGMARGEAVAAEVHNLKKRRSSVSFLGEAKASCLISCMERSLGLGMYLKKGKKHATNDIPRWI